MNSFAPGLAREYDTQLGRFVEAGEARREPLSVGYNERILPYLAAPVREQIRQANQDDPRIPAHIKELLRRSHVAQAARDQDGFAAPRWLTGDHAIYRTMAEPVLFANTTAVTGTTEALLWPAMFSSLAANFFTAGRTLKITAFGQITTSTTPGNITVTMRYGTTTGGTSLGASTATALVASQTNITWFFQLYVQCRAIGSGTAGSLIGYGMFQTGTAVIATPAQFLVPAAAQAAVAVDTSSGQGIVVGVTLGAATVNMVTSLLAVEALN